MPFSTESSPNTSPLLNSLNCVSYQMSTEGPTGDMSRTKGAIQMIQQHLLV